ncbi:MULTISPECIES: phosphotransferase family protein [Auritidibacter]|uniref:phosphotransferase family protein n=1 Tax=Auritidibacter TaxID=1160973 RepID=UPI000D7321C1|nr:MULTISPECIES: aminoglycoside phosphotransferase family protein [Auritidibacter]AXR73895.1 aminoglycoside phosphotransferase family protein [Auritidibacter sp. NML130574]NIH72760.1 aminoglycoside phosphotransferase (APT) family kinase protein [Auritidibacter ignavus]PXA80091.1 hypothetical protein DCC25_06635 [Auritidibacter sp. NML120636]RMX23830.1 aminoglycoside phosphotransferase family protein [Auritidibacter ignavus]WGH91793.1 aminoglycoside phosphotransferase family protein [Auritidiba
MASLPTDDDLALAQHLAAHLREGISARHRALIESAPWSQAHLIERGKDHRLVIVPGHLVVRIPRDSATNLERQATLLDQLAPQLPWQVPVALSIVDGGVIQPYIAGTAHPNHSGDPEQLRDIVHTLSEVDTTGLALNQPFAQRGGLTPQKVTRLAKMPGPPLPDFAQFIADVAELTHTWTQEGPFGLVHGDLAGHNMLWLQDPWRLNGVLDWDQASRWDPALNPAILSLWHGAGMLPQICSSPSELVHARVWSASMALESIENALRRQPPASAFRRLMRKTVPRLEAAQQALR